MLVHTASQNTCTSFACFVILAIYEYLLIKIFFKAIQRDMLFIAIRFVTIFQCLIGNKRIFNSVKYVY